VELALPKEKGKTEVCPPLNANVFIFLNLTLFMIKLRVLVLFSLLYR
jgi:hypothetical protein